MIMNQVSNEDLHLMIDILKGYVHVESYEATELEDRLMEVNDNNNPYVGKKIV